MFSGVSRSLIKNLLRTCLESSPSTAAAAPISADLVDEGVDRLGDEAGEATTPHIVGNLLQNIKPGWHNEQLEHWVYSQYLDTLALDFSLGEGELQLHIDRLIAKLKEAGYKPQTKKQYLQLWKGIAKAKLEKVQEKKVQTVSSRGRFSIRTHTLPDADSSQFVDAETGNRLPDAPPIEEFQTDALFDNAENGGYLTNFSLLIDEEIDTIDGLDKGKLFRGKLTLFGKTHPFEIDANDYADNQKFKAAIVSTAGARAVIQGKMDTMREAISHLSWQPGVREPVCRKVTRDFGWNQEANEYLVPSGRITASGFVPVGDAAELRVELDSEELAKHLDLQPLPSQAELRRVKKHIVDDLLTIHSSRVTYSLLAAVATAILRPFSPDAAPFALWLLGLTGAGKSFAAKLFMNFFGSFPVSSGHFAGWASTVNYLQRQGYFFKDALYLVDDYKPEVVQHYQAVRLLQNYSDCTGRGRLKVDATTNTSRPIRGLLLCSGEDLPEHTSSAIARTIVIDVPQQDKSLARGSRCQAECRNYAGVTADFIRHVLAEKRQRVFAKRVVKLRDYYYKGISGEQNDSRIANNFAMLGAAFVEIATYLRDVWPGWKDARRQFLTKDLVAIRDEMVCTVKEQQPSLVFWDVLGGLIEHKAISLSSYGNDKGVIIGKPFSPGAGISAAKPDLVYISTDLALGEVNKCLRAQGRPELKISLPTLLGQLRQEGKLFGKDGKPLSASDQDDPTFQVRLPGQRRRSFITSKALLLGMKEQPGPEYAEDVADDLTGCHGKNLP
jgi:hypothetical protein